MRVRVTFGSIEAELTANASDELTWRCSDVTRREALEGLTPAFRQAVLSHFPSVAVGVALEAAKHFGGTIIEVDGLDSKKAMSRTGVVF